MTADGHTNGSVNHKALLQLLNELFKYEHAVQSTQSNQVANSLIQHRLACQDTLTIRADTGYYRAVGLSGHHRVSQDASLREPSYFPLAANLVHRLALALRV